MADSELEAIRARRLAEMQAQQQGGRGGRGGPSQEEQEEMKAKQADMRNSILSQVLDQQARARLNTIAVAKPDKAKKVEDMLIQMTQMGQIQTKLSEDQLKSLLERVSEQTQKTKVKFDRRRAALDDSDDDM
ncbi:programmed cell death protein 5-like [Lingula anatina]|uniref:Programmed cell death protein 5-like n=1 Tax=Lingula anatina TaxID=7574 RepID=A0A1S3JAM2_LINAN|nr:programmed cell death protein 5-like [Lingula anatina]|eukprot:XP_013407455.1 programmed cell death protein 5-like [Lingula anatina]